MILIFGDSWGCGEWNPLIQNTSMNVHGGLAEYIKESGRRVLNLSQGGISPKQIFSNVESFFKSGCTEYLVHPVTKVFVFQTEYTRDDLSKYTNVHYKEIITDWYINLSVLAVNHCIDIGIIGGCSDALYQDEFENKFSRLYVACQSFANLLINNDPNTNDPVFFLRPNSLTSRDTYNTCSKQELTDVLDRANQRLQLMRDNPYWFRPDGVHPNRVGHKKLYQFLEGNGYFD